MSARPVSTAAQLVRCVAIGSTLWVAACGTDRPESPSTPPTAVVPPAAEESGAVGQLDAPAPTTAAAKYEVRFMTDMIDHHMMAVMMADVCLQKAVHDELRSTCESIITTQMTEIELMQSWLQAWYGVAHEPEMKRGMQHHMDKLAARSGAEFEIAFMEMMVRHHRAAVREGRHCTEKAYHRELVALCQSIVTAQLAEIQQMEAWLCSWYGRC